MGAVLDAVETGFDLGDEIGSALPATVDHADVLNVMNEESPPLAARGEAGDARPFVLKSQQPRAAVLEAQSVRADMALHAPDAQPNAALRVNGLPQGVVDGHRPPHASVVETERSSL